MKTKKVLIIGIDALDSLTLKKLSNRLPTFSRLMNNSNISFDGVFPPDSPTSWASIYTGLNPARHGILLFIDPLKRVSTMITQDVDDSSIRKRTFWDIAGNSGKKVIVLPHLLGYPPWDVNGLMIGRSGIKKDVQIRSSYQISDINLDDFAWTISLYPGRNKEKYVRLAKSQLKKEFELGKKLMREFDWDLFFISFGELDPIQYAYWHFYDKNDSCYPGPNKYQDVIPQFYQMYDMIVGNLMKLAGNDCCTIVVSDHGIGSRPTKLFNINEVLRRNGFLKESDKNRISNKKLLKSLILRTVGNLDLTDFAALMLKKFPVGKDWFITNERIDWEKTVSYLTDQSGIKNYPYGGILINKSVLQDLEYEIVRDKIISIFSSIIDPTDGKPIFKWIERREKLYEGEFIEKYPDILFEMRDDYGAGMDLSKDIFDHSLSHKIVPGCHKQHNATFLLSDMEIDLPAQVRMNLMDVTPTILDILGVKTNIQFDGSSIISQNEGFNLL